MSETYVVRLSRILGEIARHDLPADALAAARSRLFHALGVSFTSSALPSADAAWKAVRHDPGNCFVFGRSQRIGAEDAAFVNGVTGHSSLLEDCGPGGLREGSHPSTFIIPAALAAAESVGASGRQFVAGVVVGYEAVSRIGAAGPTAIVKRRFRPLGIMGPFGAAAAAATILGATDDQMASTLAVAANLSAGSTQGIFEGTMEPYFQAGFAARNGLLAARLALAGAVTSKRALEGEFGFFQTYAGEAADEALLLGPRAQLGICGVGTKRFAACLQNQQTVALIVDGIAEPLKSSAIKRVTITRPLEGTNGLNSPGVSRSKPFDNMLSAQMSARFTAAAALLGLAVDDPKFFQQNFSDPAIVELTERIDLVPSQDNTVSVSLELAGQPKIVLDADKSKVLFPDAATIRSSFVRRASAFIGERAEIAAGLIDTVDNLKNIRTFTDTISRHDILQPTA